MSPASGQSNSEERLVVDLKKKRAAEIQEISSHEIRTSKRIDFKRTFSIADQL